MIPKPSKSELKMEKFFNEEIISLLDKDEKIAIVAKCTSGGNYFIEWRGGSYCRTSGYGFNKLANCLACFLCNLVPLNTPSHYHLYHYLDSGHTDLKGWGFNLEFVAGLKDGTNIYQLSRI